MSTTEDFRYAPVGATATHRTTGVRAVKLGSKRFWVTAWENYLNDIEMAIEGYILDQPAPVSAREALDLAWELAYPVKKGQVIPEGTRYLESHGDELKIYTARVDFKSRSPELAAMIRTLEPLPEPAPYWLDAPAVLAATSVWPERKVWSKVDRCYKSTDGEIVYWYNLVDVTALYPNEKETKE